MPQTRVALCKNLSSSNTAPIRTCMICPAVAARAGGWRRGPAHASHHVAAGGVGSHRLGQLLAMLTVADEDGRTRSKTRHASVRAGGEAEGGRARLERLADDDDDRLAKPSE